jgi:hypothetical protein
MEKRGRNMPISDLIKSIGSIHQAYKAKAEKHPVEVIGQEAANAFNKLLDEVKRRCPENQLIKRMQPVTPNQTQLAGLLAKLVILEDSLKTEKSA